MVSSKSSMCSFFLADTSTNMLEPPHSSGMTPYSVSSWRTRSGLAPGLSILFTATTMGTSAALAWLMASMVCGMTPSSAATTSTMTSVTWAPRARMAVKASWPGVSMKALAWLMASMVCGMTPSSAATTSTMTSVTWAPRARMAVKASWPGVSMKVI